MTVRDIFGLLVRTMGLVLILYGLFEAVSLVMHVLGISTRPEIKTISVAAAAGGYIFVGLIVIMFAKPITWLAYGRAR